MMAKYRNRTPLPNDVGRGESLAGYHPEIMPLTSKNSHFSKTYTIFEGPVRSRA